MILLALALCLCVVFTAAALDESALNALWTGGCDFLFHTDNVTVTGEASFSLDGEHFKTAKLNYIQDGYSSFYGLELLTPRKDGSEQKTGWTIIADKDGFCIVMEAYEPGLYRWATCTPQNTLLRRTVRLDALTEMGGLLAGQAESLLPEGAVAVTEAEGAKTIHVALAEGQIPEILGSGLNLAACYLSSRWFSYGYDRGVSGEGGMPFEHYVTTTEALMGGTVRWTLQSADMDFTLDGQGRLTGARGTLRAASTFWDGSVRVVEVQFDLSATDYGTSHIKPFDPADYGVVKDGFWGDEEYGETLIDWEPEQPEAERASEPRPAAGRPPKTITAIASPIDPEHVASISAYARITGYVPETNEVTVELIVPETYAREEVLDLAVGDTIYTQGQEIVIRTIEDNYGYLVINAGEYEFSEDSVWFSEQEDGNFAIEDWDDYRWIVGAELKVPVRDTLLFLDSIDPSSGEILNMPTVHNAAEFLRMLKTESEEGGGPGFATDNVYAVFNDAGDLALVQRYYVPWQ